MVHFDRYSAQKEAASGEELEQGACLKRTRRGKPSAMWTCPECERVFANRNQQHSCVRVELSAHFRNRPAAIRQLFDSFVQAVRRHGPVRIVPTKTRIGFQVAMIFAALTPRNMALSGHLVLAARVPDKRFFCIETISPRNHVHHFSLSSEKDIDARFQELLAEAYAVGRQEHLRAKQSRGAKTKPRD